jgi:adenine-specific DNA-methyltransferase
MIYPRIKLARNLLKDDGVLFVSIDDNEVANLKDICGEIFGRNNFLGQICVVSNLKGRSDDKYFASAHNYLLAYSKGSFNSYGIPLPADYLDEYSLTDDEGRKYRVQGLRKRGSSAKREDRPKMFYSFFIDPGNGTIALSSTNRHTVEVIPKLSDGSDGRWRWGKETAQERLKELVAQSVGPEKRWDIFQIDYADSDGDVKRIKPKSVWMGSEFSNESGTLEVKELLGKGIFDTPKPLGLIKYLLEQTVDDDSVVVDFFAGSASTAHAVFEFNFLRQKSIKFICIQLAEDTDNKSEAYKNGYKTISDISKERIRRAGQKIKQDNVDKDGIENLDIGFRVLKIDSSNMKDVYYTPDQLNQAHLDQFTDNIKDDRTAEDLLFQVLLDWGVDLTLPITQETIAGKTVLFVDGNALAACFDADINESFVKELATRHPLRVVFRDAGFVGDSVKINVEQVFKLISPTTEIKVI